MAFRVQLDGYVIEADTATDVQQLLVIMATPLPRLLAAGPVVNEIPVFVKQLGANIHDRNDAGFDGCRSNAWPIEIEERDAVEDSPNGFREEWQGADVRVRLLHHKGGDMAEWPEDLRVREWPAVAT